MYKVISHKYQLKNGKNKNKYELNIDMRQVPYVLKFSGYDFDDKLLSEIFASKSKKGKNFKTLKILRNETTTVDVS